MDYSLPYIRWFKHHCSCYAVCWPFLTEGQNLKLKHDVNCSTKDCCIGSWKKQLHLSCSSIGAHKKIDNDIRIVPGSVCHTHVLQEVHHYSCAQENE